MIFLNLFINYLDYIVRSSKTNLNHFSIALFFSYALLTLLLNPILQRCRHFLGFSRSEFLVALALGLLGSILPTAGLTGFFLGIIASPYYFATPENGWAEYLHPHLPAWFAPFTEDSHAVALRRGTRRNRDSMGCVDRTPPLVVLPDRCDDTRIDLSLQWSCGASGRSTSV